MDLGFSSEHVGLNVVEAVPFEVGVGVGLKVIEYAPCKGRAEEE
jgi:hypothetical protein